MTGRTIAAILLSARHDLHYSPTACQRGRVVPLLVRGIAGAFCFTGDVSHSYPHEIDDRAQAIAFRRESSAASWLRELDQNEHRTMLATGGGWALDAFRCPGLQLCHSHADGRLVHHPNRGRYPRHVGASDICVWRMDYRRALRSVRPGEDVADFDPLVRVFTFLSGFTSNFTELLVCRGLQGLGFGGEWAAGSDGYSRYGTGLLLQRRTSGRCAVSNGRRVSEHLNGARRGDRAVLRSGPTCC
jgi:hypothetical protein